MPIDLETPSDDRGVGTILALPDSVAHHRNQRCAFLIVGVAHQPTKPRLHSQGAEEIPGDLLAVACVRGCLRSGSPDAERRIACLQGSEINELRRMLAEVFVCLP